jgi:hypothetical protein
MHGNFSSYLSLWLISLLLVVVVLCVHLFRDDRVHSTVAFGIGNFRVLV